MPKKSFSAEQIVTLLHQIEVSDRRMFVLDAVDGSSTGMGVP